MGQIHVKDRWNISFIKRTERKDDNIINILNHKNKIDSI